LGNTDDNPIKNDFYNHKRLYYFIKLAYITFIAGFIHFCSQRSALPAHGDR